MLNHSNAECGIIHPKLARNRNNKKRKASDSTSEGGSIRGNPRNKGEKERDENENVLIAKTTLPNKITTIVDNTIVDNSTIVGGNFNEITDTDFSVS